MISRVSSEDKESRSKVKSIKKQRLKTKKTKTVQRNIKHRRREWNPVHLHVQASACTLQYSDTHDMKKIILLYQKHFSLP